MKEKHYNIIEDYRKFIGINILNLCHEVSWFLFNIFVDWIEYFETCIGGTRYEDRTMVRGSADGRVGPGGGQGAAGHHQNNIQHQYHVSVLFVDRDLKG